MRSAIHELLADVRESCTGKAWLPRLLMWIWFAYLCVNHLRDAEYTSFLGGLNLGIHEFGHLICSPFGQFIGVAGGSLVQCMVPVLSWFMFRKQEDYFAWAFSFVWLATNLFGVALYIGDARAMDLPLVSPFGGGEGEVVHDWNFLLTEMKLLAWDHKIAACVRGLAWLCFLIGLAWGAWTLWLMITAKKLEIGGGWERRL